MAAKKKGDIKSRKKRRRRRSIDFSTGWAGLGWLPKKVKQAIEYHTQCCGSEQTVWCIFVCIKKIIGSCGHIALDEGSMFS